MDEVLIDGKTYISSKRAAHECAYTQDYVGQLCRSGQIDAKRVGGQWYVFLESIKSYKEKADTFKPEPPKYEPDPSVESTIREAGKEYISTALAAKLTHYNADYISQLARAEKIPSKHIGKRWYVEKDALVAHKSEKDAMLRAVQAESVGLRKPVAAQAVVQTTSVGPKYAPQDTLRYEKDNKPLFPEIVPQEAPKAEAEPLMQQKLIETKMERQIYQATRIPIRITAQKSTPESVPASKTRAVSIPGKPMFPAIIVPASLSVVAAMMLGFGIYNQATILNMLQNSTARSQSAAVAGTAASLNAALAPYLSKELLYTRK